MGGVVEVPDVDGPDSNADQGDQLGELLSEVVTLLLEGGLDLLGSSHGLGDQADGGGGSGAKDDTSGLARRDVGAREDNVLLVLVGGPGDRVAVLDDQD